MAKKKEKLKVYLTYVERRSGGDPIDPGRYSCREDEYIDFEMTGLFYGEPADEAIWVETIEVDFDPKKFLGKVLYVVIVRYSDGDTFGTTDGHWKVIGAYKTSKEASEIAKQIDTGKFPGTYHCWEGHFARLTDVYGKGYVLRELCEAYIR